MKSGLTNKEIAFINNYCTTYCKTKAAKAAGCSGPNPGQQGWNMYRREHVKAAIDERLKASVAPADETLKMISDRSKGNMGDYMKEVERLHVPRVKKGLQQIIDEHKLHIEMEEEFCSIKGYTEEAYDKFQEGLEYYRDQIIKLQIELKRNPNATRIVDGEAEIIKELVLDLAAVVADKERGIIKSYQITREGTVKVDICDPDTSSDRMAKIHGLYKNDNEQKAPEVTIPQINVYNTGPKMASSEDEISE